MASVSKYKVGTISKILSETSEGCHKSDPKLVALFSGSDSASSVFQTVKVSHAQFKKKPQQIVESGKKCKIEKQVKDIKLKKKNATGGEIKGKVGKEVIAESEGKTVSKKKKKSLLTVQDEAISSTISDNTGTISKRKQVKRLKKLQNVDGGSKAKIGKAPEHDATTSKLSVIRKNNKKLKKKKLKEEDTNEDEDNSQYDHDDEDDVKHQPPEGEQSTVVEKTIAEKNAPKEKDPELEARTVFVGNLPGNVNKKKLRTIFKPFGKIDTIRLRCAAPNKPTVLKRVAIYRKELHPENNTLSAYIRFLTQEDAKNSVEKAQGIIIDEHHIKVDMAASEKKDNKKAIFVGNLSLKLKDEELWKFFEDCGNILSVRVVRDNATGLGKGFGYVNFDDRGAVELALKKNQNDLQNRSIRISRCVKKPKEKKEHKNPSNPRKKFEKSVGDRREKGDIKKGRWRTKKETKEVTNAYSGDKLAEVGKLKRKSNKPNRAELWKAKVARMLTKPTNKFAPSPKRQKK